MIVSPVGGAVAAAVRARRWRILTAAVLVQLTASVITMGLPVLVPFVRTDLHLTLAEAGLFVGIPAFGSLLALFVIGWAVDRLGDRAVLVAGAFLGGLAVIASSFAPGFVVLLLMLAVAGVGTASPTPAGSTAVLHEFTRRQRGTAMSLRQAAVPLGGALGALTLAPLAASLGWRPALMLAGVGAVAGGVACLLIFPPERRLHAAAPVPEGVGGGVRRLFNRDLGLASMYAMLMCAGQFSLVSYVVLYLNQGWALPIVTGAVLLAGLQLMGAGGRLGWGWVSDRLFDGSRTGVLVIVGITASLGMLVLGWLPPATPLWVVIVVVMIAGVAVIGWSGVYFTLLIETAGPGYQGRSVALGMTLNQPGILLGPWLFGLIADLTHSYRPSWTLLAAALAGGTVFVHFIDFGRARE